MEKVPDLDKFLKKMNKKIIIKNLYNKDYCIKDFNKFKKHIWNFMVVAHQFMKKRFRVDQKGRENSFKNLNS